MFDSVPGSVKHERPTRRTCPCHTLALLPSCPLAHGGGEGKRHWRLPPCPSPDERARGREGERARGWRVARRRANLGSEPVAFPPSARTCGAQTSMPSSLFVRMPLAVPLLCGGAGSGRVSAGPATNYYVEQIACDGRTSDGRPSPLRAKHHAISPGSDGSKGL